ncbi:MAG: ATP-binding protein [Pseudonocardia sp.]|nr:ATP-binding protein [Pseudonocardia sp.]
MGEPLRVLLPAEPCSVAIARRALATWLAPLQWPEETAQDLVLAASEAVTNCVDHAYPEPDAAPDAIVLEAREHPDDDRTCVEVTVADRGRWHDPLSDQGFRGRGIEMMRALAGSVTVDGSAAGTTVVLRCWRRGSG